ncbi:neurogenic locus notch homolog protein 1 [Salarias fasciatus]|uniref:neurogenic locus notch homolog protein 1 n=1 Tax=Salarias fasciatus TaxID=181472 RepID=UPI0011767915|nr:neurogenic locus notch homolog protein 1-like [Salarias fasciatus]XP_029959460.1 neurogenic locus notch homolog protein 1-like [Salarias fasciatus]
MLAVGTLVLVLLGLIWTCGAVSSDPWVQCPVSRKCQDKFGDGSCDRECLEADCLRDGFDCLKDRGHCNPGHVPYCRDHFADSHCELGCDSAPCGWDGGDCLKHQSSQWAKGTLVVHTSVPLRRSASTNTSVLWALSVLLQSPLRLRGSAPLAASRNLFDYNPQELEELLARPAPDADGSLLFVQVDNRPCSRLSSCFPYATEAAGFLRAALQRRRPAPPPPAPPPLPELTAVINVRGVRQEIGDREDEEVVQKEVRRPTPAWLWAVVAIAVALLLVVPLAIVLVVRRVRRRRRTERDGDDWAGHRSKPADGEGNVKVKGWMSMSQVSRHDQRVRSNREKDRVSLKKKKKAREAEKKRRREPLGEDAIRMRPLRRDQEVGSDTDFTQSSMEDVSMRCSRRVEDAAVRDHRTQEQKLSRAGPSPNRRAVQPPPRGWERSAMPPPLLSPPQQSAEWCGPDGSVVLIRAVRSGLDRVVLELLRAGVPVNNTDHTGRSALHWACSVNHLTLARTLIRYGAAVDLQDNKGETPLFLSALHGCSETSRLLLLHGASLDLRDRRGRRPADVAGEGLQQQVLELLAAPRVQRDAGGDPLWNQQTLAYSPWAESQGLPGRSASFSGVVGHRDLAPPPRTDWSMGLQAPPPQNWRPQLSQSATALVPPRVMGRSPRPISTLQEVTSEDEDRERQQEVPRAATPHFLYPQPAPRQRSFSCSQHALQRRCSPAPPQPEPHYLMVTEQVERVPVPAAADPAPPPAPPPATNAEQKARGQRLNNAPDSTQTAL